MSTVTITQMAQGQLASSKGTLYTCPAATQAIIKTITLVNTDASARTVNLYISTGTSRRIIPKTLNLNVGDVYIVSDVLTLAAGHLLEGDASAAAVVDYIVSGVQEA